MQAFIVLAAWLLTGAPSTQAQDQDNHDYTAEATFSLNDPWSSSDMMTTCCSELSNILPDRVFFPGSDIYDQSENSYYCANTREIRPNCILRPQSTQEISAAIRLLSSKLSDQDSAPSDCQFGVRGGVHTAWKGANNIESGVTIDLSQLTDIQLSPDRSIVTVEGGSTWDQVYKYLEGYKLGTLGGRVTGIGVGGLTLGGGISFFSARYGFVCDNLESIELVMADGKVENVSSTAHPDLFRALKGGSNNFGVVTKFRMRTFPSGEFWGGQVYYNMSTVDQQLAAFEKVVGSPDFDPYAAMIHSYAWSAEMSIVVTMFTHTKVPASDSVPEFLSEMVNIPNMGNSTRIAPISSFTDELNAYQGGPRALFATMTFRNSARFSKQLYDLAETYATALLPPTIPGFSTSITYQPLPQILTSKGGANGGNVLGFTPEDGDVVNAILSTYWRDASDDARVEAESKRLFEDAQRLAKEEGVDVRALYLNYAGKWQDPIGGYGEDEVRFLREVSLKHDPEGVFQKGMPGGFKLWGVNGTG